MYQKSIFIFRRDFRLVDNKVNLEHNNAPPFYIFNGGEMLKILGVSLV